MKDRVLLVGVVTIATAFLSLAAPGQAQQPQDMVPLKAVARGTAPAGFLVPVNPPIVSFQVQWTGESDLLGPFTYFESSQAQVGADGAPLTLNNAVAALTGANGDAIFVRFSGLVHLTATGVTCDHAFVIVGGKGRFVGATGSGTIKGVSDIAKNEGSLTFDGMISRPSTRSQ
jgi:hypothetical protein